MVLLELATAHLLGDFVFQSNDLILKKYRSWKGTFQHVLIISFFTVLVLFPYWNHKEAWMVAGVIFLVHFLQDLLKIEYDVRYNQKKKSVLPFFLDQIFHLALIAYLSPMLKDLTPLALPSWVSELYASEYLAVYILGLILFSYTYDITLYQFERKKAKKPMEYKPNFKGMRNRILIFTIVYAITIGVYRSAM